MRKVILIIIAIVTMIITIKYLTTGSSDTPEKTVKAVKAVKTRTINPNPTLPRTPEKVQLDSINRYNTLIKPQVQSASTLLKAARTMLIGVDDRYDYSGKKIYGIAPDVYGAIRIYLQLVTAGNQTAAYELGQLYRFGHNEIAPDQRIAKQYYQQAFELAGRNGDVHTATRANIAINNMAHEEPLEAIRPLLIEELPVAAQAGKDKNVAPIAPMPPRQPHLDVALKANNVHEHSIVSSIKDAYFKLKNESKKLKPKSKTLVHQEVKKFVEKYAHADKREDALLALKAVVSNREKLMTTGSTDFDALQLVWNRIENNYEDPIRQNLKENLVNELAEMVEHGIVCCLTGRFTRILDALNFVDDAVKIKPERVIHDEMMNKAALIREDILKNQPAEQVELYHKGTNDELDKTIKDAIKSVLYDEYVKTDILTESVFNKSIGEWINEI